MMCFVPPSLLSFSSRPSRFPVASRASTVPFAVALFVAGCGGGATSARPAKSAAAPASTAADGGAGMATSAEAPRTPPPASFAPRPSPFPKVDRKRLASGLEVATVELHALPLVQIRVLVRAGTGYGGAPGLADFAAQMLKDGGTKSMTSAKLFERIEGLGANLEVDVGADKTVLSLGVSRENMDEALHILAEVIGSPRFDESEFKKLKDREADLARDLSRSDTSWMASRVIFRELFADASPYATFGLVPSEIGKVTLPKVREFHQKFYVPKNTKVVLAGDVDSASAAGAIEEAFADYKAISDAPKVDFPPAIAPQKLQIVVANRPKSTQSNIYVVNLAPVRNSPDWPAVRVATQVLGGGPGGRLFRDIREQRSLAYDARAWIMELANGPQPIIAYAGTQTAKTGPAVQAILENLARIEGQPPEAQETENARRHLSDNFAIRMETVGAIADLIVLEDSLRLPDGYWDAYRNAVRGVEPNAAFASAAKLFAPNKALVVVVGDAARIVPALTAFGDVTVVNPEREFITERTVAAPPQAAAGTPATP